jgi:hypothetical protein
MNLGRLEDLKAVLDLVQQAGATRFLQTPAFGAIGAGVTSAPQNIRFTEEGFVVGLYGNVQSGAVADYAGTSLRVQIGGTEDLFVDGLGGPVGLPFLMLFGGIQNMQPIVRRVIPGDLWAFSVTNNTAGNVTPLAAVSFLADRDVRLALETIAAIKSPPRR